MPAVRGRLLVLAACLAVVAATAWYAGSRFDPPAAAPSSGTVRLGPEPGEDVAAYLARLPGELPAPGTAVLALVQLGAEVTPAEAAALVAGNARLVSVVFHVPMPRVQSALRFVAVEPGPSAVAALDRARGHARFLADADATRLTGRQAAVASAEAAALADPACRCVPAMVVAADRQALDALAARPGVRAVHAAPAGVTPPELALAPLLPEQRERADPIPDDGPVPPG
ncbi:hypothetical protein [Pseudonocardia sp.]|uniref:hypothetical protein n=1 Tax=Pseudonocardia sp. TaxID=60912 RepID=UPI003D125DF2